ncbi:hypothetical protein KMT30_09985 [Streptomyces sp. IBSBF 2953]|nr:hypothetical protein [Streptomyces hayashii]
MSRAAKSRPADEVVVSGAARAEHGRDADPGSSLLGGFPELRPAPGRHRAPAPGRVMVRRPARHDVVL